MEKSKLKAVVILGPTASGKSDVAIKLAKKYNGEIISADSRQVYRKMNIGTGKVTGRPRPVILSDPPAGGESKDPVFMSQNIPHHMIDIVSPKTDYNVAKFKKTVNKIIPDILKRGKLPIICGGTGFWIKAIVDNVTFPKVPPNKTLRNKLSKKSAGQLFKMLKKLDPERAKTIDRYNKVRLIRAIEIVKILGKVPNLSPTPSPYQGEGWGEVKFLQIGIKLPKEKLNKNIKNRLNKRFRRGMIKEVANLRKSGLSWKKIQSFGLGYYWIPLYLQGKIDKKELFEKIYQSEKDYAKRQMTWFRKDKRIKWLANYKMIEKEVKKFLKNRRVIKPF